MSKKFTDETNEIIPGEDLVKVDDISITDGMIAAVLDEVKRSGDEFWLVCERLAPIHRVSAINLLQAVESVVEIGVVDLEQD